jgi:hypothetical protein
MAGLVFASHESLFMTTKTSLFVLLSLLGAMTAIAAPRSIPQPLPRHPGNVFQTGESIVVRLPRSGDWQVSDFDHKVVATGTGAEARVGLLPVGYYELRLLADGKPESNRITLGVVAPLKSPTPETSPIGIDVAMAWFYSGDQRDSAANLCALAGMNWVRDRLTWGEMEPRKGEFVSTNKYDESAHIQSAAGLRVLQVHHSTPSWASTNTQHQPPDLRDAYRFMREMARRWQGRVHAFEPWNEADIEVFGGHSGVEMASLQKASYLGLKAGNSNVIACLNVFATPQKNILADLHANDASAYFDTFNLHHYCAVNQYPAVYETFRQVSDGKPLWVTEFNAPVHWKGDDQEPTDQDLRLQAERVPQVFASALQEGPVAAFYFMLPHYCEGETQFGILHRDLSPRPAYLALAAVGRILADARPLGKFTASTNVQAFAFNTQTDGQPHEVLIAWATKETEARLPVPSAPTALYDVLGRSLATGTTNLHLSPSPVYAVFPAGTLNSLSLEKAPQPPTLKHGKTTPIVLQLAAPKERLALNLSAWKVSSEKPESLPVVLYNFSAHKVAGTLSASHPKDWTVTLQSQVEIEPGGRLELPLTVDCHNGASSLIETIKIIGNFGEATDSVLSFRLTPTPFKLREGQTQPIPDAMNPSRWQPLFSSATAQNIAAGNGNIHVTATLKPEDRWAYPILTLRPEERPTTNANAFVVTLTATRKASYRLIVDEDNGSSYSIDLSPQPGVGESVEAIAVLSAGTHGDGWSKPDDNGKLDPENIRSLKIGCNAEDEAVDYSFKNLRWVNLNTTP